MAVTVDLNALCTKGGRGQAGQEAARNNDIPGMRQGSLAAAIVRVPRAQNDCPGIEPKSHVSAEGGELRGHVVRGVRGSSWQLLLT